MPRKRKPNYNDGIEAAAKLHDDASERYLRSGAYTDSASHRQWAENIRRLKKREPEPAVEPEDGFIGKGS